MRISDWSSDVCSSDLEAVRGIVVDEHAGRHPKRLGARAGQGAGLEFRQQFLAIGQRILDRAGKALDLGSEERRVGEEWGLPCRSRWWPDHYKKKTSRILNLKDCDLILQYS